MLWGRLIHLKAKRAHTQLTQTELNFRRYFTETEYNMPQPLYLYLKAIGEVTDTRGKRLHLVDHTLPVSASGNRSGYHAATIDNASHNMFEEVPTMGVSGDVLMAMTSEDAHPVPTIPILPEHTVATQNLVGFPGVLGVRKEEIKQILNSFGITTEAFSENIANTRFNSKLVLYVSDVLGKASTYRNEKVNLSNLTIDGSEVQLILSRPSTTENDQNILWRNAIIQPRTVSSDSTATVVASYYTGFQVEKEAFANSNSNWCCIAAAPQTQWVIPAEWIANRNARRALPNNYAVQEFVGIFDSQEYCTTQIIRRMIVEKGNLDIQVICEKSTILSQYITKYQTKEEKSFDVDVFNDMNSNKSLQQKIWNIALRSLNSRECGALEAADTYSIRYFIVRKRREHGWL